MVKRTHEAEAQVTLTESTYAPRYSQHIDIFFDPSFPIRLIFSWRLQSLLEFIWDLFVRKLF